MLMPGTAAGILHIRRQLDVHAHNLGLLARHFGRLLE
jgi:hypothetical protein